MKKMLMKMERKEEGSAAGAVLAVFVLFILIIAFVVVSTHFGLTWSNIVNDFKKFTGLIITLGGR
jgi:Flp pilus assembly pilin Flp